MKSKNNWIRLVVGGFVLMAMMTNCRDEVPVDKNLDGDEERPTFFQLLDSTQTGIGTVNRVADRQDFNILTYRNYYNGGGVAIGDVNNDGRPDLYFTSNLTANRLFLNKGNFAFEEVTEAAGVAGTRAWSTGVTMVDINSDGWLDIYVSNSGDIAGDNKENELFVNQQDGTFTEEAVSYGLNNRGYSTQAAFFDYDLDGDLDCYLLNNSFKDPSKIELFSSMRDRPDPLGGDKLYRNDGGTFVDVTEQAGIYSSVIGFGLGTCIGDLNHDLYPDIYVSNDFWERDYLYINQGDGSFSEELIDRIDFCSISSMGGDIGDINNDGHPEIISTDMLAADNYRLKAMSTFDPYHLENLKYRANYHYQIGQNCLHLNDGTADFQEIAHLANVAATDWSWGALIFDFENDGRKDLFVSNGIQKDLMYMDFRDFLSDNRIFQKIASGQPVDYPSLMEQMPSNPLPNYAFSNRQDLVFQDQAQGLGLGQLSFSNGAAYADLDDDGDFDLVVNNVNMPAFIYENQAESLANHFLKLEFKGPPANPFGIGAFARITTSTGLQTLENFNTRGFESAVEPKLIFGLGRETLIDKLEIIWPDKKSQVLTDVEVDQVLQIDYQQATGTVQDSHLPRENMSWRFQEVTDVVIQGDATHQENQYNDFDHEALLIKMGSTQGPKIIRGDANGDGRDDFVLLGARDDEDNLFLQSGDGTFVRKNSLGLMQGRQFESTCGAWIDLDQDGDQDLLLGSGGNESQRTGDFYTLRYYQNDGKGNLTADQEAAPKMVGNFSCLEANDYDGDGDMDLFLGAQIVPGNYGLPPRSFLLENENGKWQDVSPEALAGAGMVTDATWTDIDGDQDQDLIIVGDWSNVHIFKNNDGQISYLTPIRNSSGWWNCIEAADLDGDGDQDFVVGNWGLNSKFKASVQRPLGMYVNDFDQNGKPEPIVTWYAPLDKEAYPFATKMDLTTQLPGLRKRSLKYEDYAGQTYASLFDQEVRQKSLRYEAKTLHSAILWNDAGHFTMEPLPIEAQIAPVFSIVVHDLSGNGQLDIWLGGNFYGLKPQAGRHDASRGVLLEGQGGRNFKAVSSRDSGIRIEREVRDAHIFSIRGEPVLLVARNNESLVAFQRQ
ncbi:MAG: VCBS repeat-containing protein [Saprospiraceae bacterium]|nr:VCBS repeat-containing protein [Saprospiraceae bacterium]